MKFGEEITKWIHEKNPSLLSESKITRTHTFEKKLIF